MPPFMTYFAIDNVVNRSAKMIWHFFARLGIHLKTDSNKNLETSGELFPVDILNNAK